MDEDYEKMLYIRLPHTIKNMDEIRDLFAGDVKIKLPRQSSRHCHVTFSTVEEKMKNLKEVRKKMIDNKRIIACPPKLKLESRKKAEKKTVVPNPKPAQKITQILYVTNINPKTKLKGIRRAMGDCKSVTFLDNTGKSVKQAIVRLSDPKLAAEYLKKERSWPVVDGNQLIIKSDTRKQKKKKPGLKIWDGDVEITNDVEGESNDVKSDEKKSKEKKEMKVKSDEKKSKEKKEIKVKSNKKKSKEKMEKKVKSDEKKKNMNGNSASTASASEDEEE